MLSAYVVGLYVTHTLILLLRCNDSEPSAHGVGLLTLCCIISFIIDKKQHSFIFSKSVEECVDVALNERTLNKREKSSPLHTIVFCMALKALHNSSQIVVHKRHI